MGAAYEATLVDASYGTNSRALSTTGTERIIDGSEIVLYLDCAVRTSFLALHTSNTTVSTDLTGNCALIVIGAFNGYLYGIVYHLDDLVGAGSCTDTATDTLLGIDLSNVVFNADCVLGTYLNAVTVTETSIGTGLIAGICQVSGEAASKSLIIELSGGCVAGTVTGNVRYLFNNVLSLNAENCGNTLSGIVTAGDTEVGLSLFAFAKCFCVTVTAAITASSAVCTGEAVSHGYGGFVFLNAEEYGGKGKEYRAYYCYNCKKDNGNNNSHCSILLT